MTATRADAFANLPDIVAPHKLAKYLGVSNRTICNWRQSGKLPEPLFWVNNRARWSRAQIIEALLQKQEESCDA
jgi:predicted site-specific integrase-resolvase